MAADTRSDLRLAIESVLFVAHGPVDIATLARVAGVSEDDVEEALKSIAGDYRGKGLRVQRTGDAAQFVSAPEAAPYVESFLGIDESQTISPAALETLAIIAYKQPITRSTIERIRGVNCDYAVAVLKARSLITEVGRAASPGRPYLYGTTFRFLEHFGLEKPEDLPPLPELDRALEAAGGQNITEILPLPASGQEEDQLEAPVAPESESLEGQTQAGLPQSEVDEEPSAEADEDGVARQDEPDDVADEDEDEPDYEPPEEAAEDVPPWE
jgi:segregation and condensation protein B